MAMRTTKIFSRELNGSLLSDARNEASALVAPSVVVVLLKLVVAVERDVVASLREVLVAAIDEAAFDVVEASDAAKVLAAAVDAEWNVLVTKVDAELIELAAVVAREVVLPKFVPAAVSTEADTVTIASYQSTSQ